MSKTAILLISLLGAAYGFNANSESLLNRLAQAAFQSSTKVPFGAATTVATLDKVTYVLADTTLFLMQLGKTGLGFTGYIEDPYELFDFVFNTTLNVCEDGSGCEENYVYMEFRDMYLSGMAGIRLHTDFQPSSFNLTLTVEDLSLGLNGYRHTITNNRNNRTKHGEGAHFALREAVYGIKGDYSFVPNVGLQVSNIDLTLNIGMESWRIDRRYIVLENGFIVEEGVYDGDLAEDVMDVWKGDLDGRPFEPQYEQRAQFLLNCGLSGGRSSEGCSEVREQLKRYNMRQ